MYVRVCVSGGGAYPHPRVAGRVALVALRPFPGPTTRQFPHHRSAEAPPYPRTLRSRAVCNRPTNGSVPRGGRAAVPLTAPGFLPPSEKKSGKRQSPFRYRVWWSGGARAPTTTITTPRPRARAASTRRHALCLVHVQRQRHEGERPWRARVRRAAARVAEGASGARRARPRRRIGLVRLLPVGSTAAAVAESIRYRVRFLLLILIVVVVEFHAVVCRFYYCRGVVVDRRDDEQTRQLAAVASDIIRRR